MFTTSNHTHKTLDKTPPQQRWILFPQPSTKLWVTEACLAQHLTCPPPIADQTATWKKKEMHWPEAFHIEAAVTSFQFTRNINLPPMRRQKYQRQGWLKKGAGFKLKKLENYKLCLQKVEVKSGQLKQIVFAFVLFEWIGGIANWRSSKASDCTPAHAGCIDDPKRGDWFDWWKK